MSAPVPPYPVPIVRAIVPDPEGRILLLKRDDTAHGLGGWCLPGGKIDLGQTMEEALARELAEETELRLAAAEFLMVQDSLPPGPGGMHCINIYFVCRAEGETRLNRESSQLAWVGSGDLDRYRIVFRNDEAIRRHFGRAGSAERG